MGPSRRDGRERREALLNAALGCFAERGVPRTGIEQIRKAAGASPSSVYHQFGGLEDITVAVLMRTFDRLFGQLTKDVCRTRSAKGAVHALVRGQIQWVLDNRDEARVMYQALSFELTPSLNDELQTRKATALLPIVQHVAPFVRAGELPPWPPMLLDVTLLGPTHEACRRFLAGAEIEPKWMLQTLPALAWRSIQGTTSLR